MTTPPDPHMLTVRCPCGAALRAPARLHGKKAVCPKCKNRVRVVDPQRQAQGASSGLTLMTEDENRPLPSGGSTSGACPNCHQPVPPEARICVRCGTDLFTGARIVPHQEVEQPQAPATRGAINAYLRDCLAGFWIVIRPGNLVKFAFLLALSSVAVMLLVMPMFGCFLSMFRLFAAIACIGWICSFLFNVVVYGAAGDDEFPDLNIVGSWWDDGIVPFFKFVGTALVVQVPALSYATAIGLGGFAISQGDDPIFSALFWCGLFFWPICMLMAALGGMGCFLRPDLIVKTVARTFLPYLTVCGMTGGAIMLGQVATDAAQSSGTIFGGSPWVVSVVLGVLNLVCLIVAMRCIGLYYHHFKDRFAWSWG